MRLHRLPLPALPSPRLVGAGGAGLLAGVVGGWLLGLLRAPRQPTR